MATTTSFKQQCPSCEAMVPIRDPGLIGKKIDCPKCKYRFVVEEPEAPEDAEEEVKPAKSGKGAGAVTEKRSVNGKGKSGMKRRPDAEDDDEAPAPQKKKEGGSTTLILGVGLAFVAILLLAVGGYFLLGGSSDDGSKPSPKGSGTTSTPSPSPEKPPETTTETKTAATESF